ncbi:MAG: sigma factor [Actinomycetota bacterium]
MTDDAPRRDRFEALYREHRRPIVAFAMRRVPADRVEDVVADTFLVAWRRLPEVPADALPWLYAVAGHVVRNDARAARRGARLLAKAAAQGEATGGAMGVEEADGPLDGPLGAALRALSPTDRETLFLAAWEGVSGRRAATAAGSTRAAFAVRLHRARRRLAGLLEESNEAGSAPTAAPLRTEET